MNAGIHEVSGSRPLTGARQAGDHVRSAFADKSRSFADSAIQSFIIAFSGGADSVLAAHAASLTGRAMTLYYLHHYDTPVEPARSKVFREIRARYSNATWLEEQADVSRIAKRLGNSWEHTASLVRRKRLLWLRAATPGAEVVTGHNYSDYLETIALRRERKIPEAFLPALSEYDEVSGFWRPLFKLSREEVRARAAALGFSWFDDASNTDLRFARNRMRVAPPPSASPAGVISAFSPPGLEEAARSHRELRLPLERWHALAKNEKARTLFYAFRRLAIVRKFTRGHFARAHKLPFAVPPFFAHTESDAVIFRRGLGQSNDLPAPEASPYVRGDAITRSYTIAQPYGKKSLAKIFSEKKISPRQRRRTIVYQQPESMHKATRVVFPDGTTLRATDHEI